MFALSVLLIDFCLDVDADAEVVRLTRVCAVHRLIDSIATISCSFQPSR